MGPSSNLDVHGRCPTPGAEAQAYGTAWTGRTSHHQEVLALKREGLGSQDNTSGPPTRMLTEQEWKKLAEGWTGEVEFLAGVAGCPHPLGSPGPKRELREQWGGHGLPMCTKACHVVGTEGSKAGWHDSQLWSPQQWEQPGRPGPSFFLIVTTPGYLAVRRVSDLRKGPRQRPRCQWTVHSGLGLGLTHFPHCLHGSHP